MADQNPELTTLQKAALAMKVLRARVDELEHSAAEPIAIVGLGCRYPAGSDSPAQFWDAVSGGRDGSMEVPAERWDIDSLYDPTPGVAGKMYVRKSCFIDGVDRFDPLFFRISPREAIGIDPQQRLLLEVAWEALEDAGIPPPSLVGSRTGVFLGISTNDYSALLARTAHGSGSNATAGAGNSASVASGRISYTFGFQGPCMAIDTACSSSLVAAHLAVQSLRTGECKLALVAGVNLMLSPEITVNFSQGRMLSPDGHCKTFDAAADGYVRGEGCGVLVLKRLSDALAAGDTVHAVIRGSAVNQDGRSAGLTAPNGLAQEAVIRQALANAHLDPDAVDYIEAHGTGTSLGDPIEMHALKAVFAKSRERPLYVGSVKTNIGHAEAASGVAGLIKATLMLRHQTMPPHLNFTKLNPHIDLSGIDIRIPTQMRAMPIKVAGVSSFGFSGTNAHLVLEAAPPVVAPKLNAASQTAPPQLFLSARTKNALQELIARYDALLASGTATFADVCHAAATGRARLAWWVLVDHPSKLRSAVPSNAAPPVLPLTSGRKIALPTYPFERERYWVDATPLADPAPLAHVASGTHPLLGRKLTLPLSTQVRWEAAIGSSIPELAFLEEHRVNDQAVMPGTCFIEMALAAHPGCEILDLRIPAPLLVQPDPLRMVQTICEADGNFRIVSYAPHEDSGEILTHAVGRAVPLTDSTAPAVPQLPATATALASAQIYEAMERLGVRHGPSFRLLRAVMRANGVAASQLDQAHSAAPVAWAALHPAALDAALQVVAAALPEAGSQQLVPTRFGRIRAVRAPQAPATVRASARREGQGVIADILIEDAQGIAIQITDLQFGSAAAGVADPGVVNDPRAGMYQLDWTPSPLLEGVRAPHFFPQVAELAGSLAAESERLGQLHDMASYALAGDELERIATGYVVQALSTLGMSFRIGSQLTFGALAGSLGIEDVHDRLLTRMLSMLEQDGILVKRGRLWQVAEAPPPYEIDAAIAALLVRFPQMAGEIGMVRRCGAALAEVLTGRADALGLLFPANDEGAGVFYATSAYAHTVNGLLKDAATRLAASLPPGRALRVLEVGAGTGGATSAILDGLAGVACSYTFTDVSPAFLNEALKKFAGHPITPQLLDIERDPAVQGFGEQGFDLVVAANVLHATRDIRRSLAHIHKLLAADGMLLLVESTAPRRWVDILFGLTSGWWHFEDTDLRPAHPLLSHGQWHDVLQETGFEPGENASTEVIVARRTAGPDAGPADQASWYIGGVDALGLGDTLAQSGRACTTHDAATRWVVMVGPTEVTAEAQSLLFRSLVELVQIALSQYKPPQLALVATADLGHAGLPGFVRALALEHPGLNPRLLLDPPGAACLADELASANGEPEVRWSNGTRQVARIAPAAGEQLTPSTTIGGTWLITGGYGGLGLHMAQWLAAQGASRIVLLGRHKPAQLPALNAIVSAHEGDVADASLLASIIAGIPDLEGVIHAAGALADAPVVEQSEQTINTVLHPKLAGALALDRAVRGMAGSTLKHFVLFASVAGVVGSAGQSNHAFCSTFLDGLAAARRRQGQPALSLDWGVWKSIGAAARKGFDAQADQLGLGSITPEQGVAAFGAALGADNAQLILLPSVDWQRFTGHLGALLSPLYQSVLASSALPVDAGRQDAAASAAALAPIMRTHEDAASALARIVGELLSLPRDFDREIPLAELGLDSLVAVEIKNQVLRDLGVELSVRELIEGVSLSELATRVASAGPQEEALPQALLVPDLAKRHLPFPLTEMQQAFWVGRRGDLALGGINCYLYTEFDTRVVDMARLEQAWNVLILRHDMLRLVLQEDGQQRILPEVPYYRFEVCDLRAQAPQQAEAELARLRTTLARRVVPADSWPLFDIRITHFGDTTRLHLGFDLIALDAASIIAVRQELGQLYDDPATVLAPIGLSFRDYVLHLQASRSSPEWQHSEQYWKARAHSLPDAPELPLLPPSSRPAHPDFKRYRIVTDAASSALLKQQAQARGLTVPSVLAAAYADVLAMWSRSAHFCLTVTLFNRPPLHPDMGSIIGDFTSTILLEVDASAPTFTQRAQALLRRMASDLDHAGVSGIQVLREIARQNGQGLRTVPVVFTSTLGFRRPAADEAGGSDGTLWDRFGTTVYNVSSTPQVWIDHQISEEDGALFCNWDILQGLFPDGVVDDMMTAYRAILDGLVGGDGWDRPIAAVPLLSAQRAPLQLTAPAECLHAAFERQAARTPERIALVVPEQAIDYGTLALASAHLAAILSARLGGTEGARDRLVAVCFPKGWRQIVAVLAILKSGAAYLPVDPALPAGRRQLLIEQGEALMLDDDTLLDAVLLAAQAGQAAPALPAMDDTTRLAYVIYTSGSTGMPKGVMIEHAAALTTVREINRRWQVGPDDRVLGLSALSFDLSVYDIFGPLSVGGALILPEPAAARDPSRWSALLSEYRITLWNTVPALMAMQVEYGLPAGHALRLIMLSGDWVPLDLVARLKQVAPASRIVALGGATEAAIWSNAHEIDALDPDWPSIPYGLPLAGHQLHVVNSHFEACPNWATGQIEISGQGLARGYWRDPARTAERFRIDAASGERRYRTGDLGRFRPYAGAQESATPIEFLGREDAQVKVQGHRIELGEIEAALEAHPQVSNAVATVFGSAGSQARSLHAFVVPRVDGSAGADWQALVEAGREAARRDAQCIDAAAFEAVADATSTHTLSAAAAALRTLAGPGQALDWRALIEVSGVAPRYEHWLKRMLPQLEKIGQSGAPVSTTDIARLDLFGFGAADFALLTEVARRLPDILTERMHSSDIYLSAQTPEVYAKLFGGPNAIIANLLQKMAQERPVSVLEVGGGLGTTLAAIAPGLPGDRLRYHFTDLSAHMVRRARESFALPWLSFGTLDFDREPEADAPRYDAIVASSALHVAADVRRTLAHLVSMLAPGGVLIVLEQTRFFPWFDLNMGLQAGFDARTDRDLRPDHPLLSRTAWQQVLRDAGFVDVCGLQAEGSKDERLGVEVFIARAPQSAQAAGQLRPQEGGELGAALTDWVRARLPAYMVPKTIDLIDRIPLSSNGKVDRSLLDRLLQQAANLAGKGRVQQLAENDMQQQVAALVRELLPQAEDDPGRSLFEMGATSLTLVSLHRLMGDRLGYAVPLQAMFEAPTISSLARALSGMVLPPALAADIAPSFMPDGANPIVAFGRRHGDEERRPTLVMMPGVLALPFYLRGLAATLADDVALVTLQLPGMFGADTPLDTVEAQADYAVHHLRSYQPQGPYLLAGHSYGGYVAIEMARRLRAAGEEVPLLILGDSVRTSSTLDAFQSDEVAWLAMTRALYALYGKQLAQPYEEVEKLGPRAGFDATAAAIDKAGVLGPVSLSFERMATMFKANFRALGAYRPQQIPGDVMVVRTEGGFPPEFHDYETADALNDPALGWTGMVQGRLQVHTMPGDHLSMQDDANMAVFADILRKLVLDHQRGGLFAGPEDQQ